MERSVSLVVLMRPRSISRVLLAAIALATFTGCASDRPSEDPGGGTAAPSFTVTTFAGERFSLEEMRGTPVVLNFWESW
jgi:cytochrome c biogenesis protein CcmG, thiol:disulfide interchange protein DsbE